MNHRFWTSLYSVYLGFITIFSIIAFSNQCYALKLIRTLVPAHIEINTLHKKFDGLYLVDGKSVDIDYEHIFSIGEVSHIKKSDQVKSTRIYGWHHDYQRKFGCLGFVRYKNIVKGFCGAFKADLVVLGKTYKNKTFFPPKWTPEKVIEKIFEVFENEKCRETFKPDKWGYYTINGCTKEGLEIRVIFDFNTSMIKTAYPLVVEKDDFGGTT